MTLRSRILKAHPTNLVLAIFHPVSAFCNAGFMQRRRQDHNSCIADRIHGIENQTNAAHQYVQEKHTPRRDSREAFPWFWFLLL
jgi:hypothetical protein